MIFTAAISSVVSLGIDEAWSGPAREEAEARQIIIEERTGRIDEGVTTLHATLAALQSAQSEADFQAFGQEAQRLVEQIEQLSPLLEQASSESSAQLALLRQQTLAQSGVTTASALQLAYGGSATICGEFLLAVRPTSRSAAAHLVLSRHGESTSESRAEIGDSITMATPRRTAVATVTGFGLGPDGNLVGINFDCLPGT
ncbi:hypothetical protein [uncultured Paracoccus sp.]|uniref:hypothetical protein n=1 Tax=uncultured Paracoccus sp. TaxID=189685 RepID=UPI0025EAAA5F|nr:hypothetical protein [uncultured Paracoccus sp.]